MDEQHAREAIVALLTQKGRATDAEMLALVGSNRERFGRIREQLILDALADDESGVGLIGKKPALPTRPGSTETGKFRLFLSYGRSDASELADRLCADLAAKDFEVWRDTRQIPPGSDWQAEFQRLRVFSVT